MARRLLKVKQFRSSENWGGTFRVNFKCPECGTHIRVPIKGYGRTGWNARNFHCFKCQKHFTFHISCIPFGAGTTPPVGAITQNHMSETVRSILDETDYLDLVFFNGFHFRPRYEQFLRFVCSALQRLTKDVPGFSDVFREEFGILQEAVQRLELAIELSQAEYKKGKHVYGG